MKTKEWTFVDRSNWAPGPWDSEPDKRQWLDKATGLPCLAVRNEKNGHWCGYVGVEEGSVFFEKDANCEVTNRLEMHGGLTFNSFCLEGNKEHGVCHIVEPGENDRVWWFGFDCAHAGDYAPAYTGMGYMLEPGHDSYRDLAYVKAECESLAAQLKLPV